MKYSKCIILAAVLCAGSAAAAWAQMGMGMRPPTIPGEFKPVVGSGAQYAMTVKGGQKMEMAIAVVGKETFEGQEGYWMETRILGEGRGAGMIMKQLMVMSGDKPGIKRMIMQPPGRPPMEMPIGMMGGMGRGMPKSQPETHGQGKVMGEVVGTETITVPAGTFECQHFRSHTEQGANDVWVSTKVSPYGMVKMTSEDGTSGVLEKVLEHETSQITGEPQKMSFPGMPQ